MNIKILEEIGLSPNEAKVYLTLLELGDSSVSQISVKANIHRRNVYDVLNRLIEKGLVFVIFQKSENLYKAAGPEKLIDILQEKESKFKKILPELQTLFNKKPQEISAYIYKGIEGYKNYRRDLLSIGQDTYFLGSKALWLTPGIETKYHDAYKKLSKAKGFKYYTLFDYRVKEQIPKALNLIGGEYKVLPKQYSTSGVVDIFGDYVVTFTSAGVGNFGDDGYIFVIKNKDLAESYRTWFKFIWDFCPKEK